MKNFLGILFCIPIIVLTVLYVRSGIVFDIECTGHLVRASVANSVDLAIDEMEAVVKYAEDNEMTSGNTSVLWDRPVNDVGFWYKNMKSSLEELRRAGPQTSELEKSNMLLKLRETVSHVPEGLARFPDNSTYVYATFTLGLLAFVGFLLLKSKPGRNDRSSSSPGFKPSMKYPGES